MPLRVFRLLTLREQTWAYSDSFISSLRIAAGRAWVRRVSGHPQSKSARRKSGIRTGVEAEVACSSRRNDYSAK